MSCVKREVTLPLDADAAWEAVTDLDDWLVEDFDLALAPGEEGTLRLPDGEERRAVVDDVAPGERLAFWWWAGDEREATHVSLTLSPTIDGGTRVVVVESGFAAGPVLTAGAQLGPVAAGAVHRTAVGALPVGLVTPLLRAAVLAERLEDLGERRAALV